MTYSKIILFSACFQCLVTVPHINTLAVQAHLQISPCHLHMSTIVSTNKYYYVLTKAFSRDFLDM